MRAVLTSRGRISSALIQLDPIPQHVVLTNQRDLQLYDLARDRAAPRLSVRIDDLPKYSEAFPFFTQEWVPGATPKIVNVEKVSAEVADLVARLYRSVRAAHPARDRDVIRFTLQCIPPVRRGHWHVPKNTSVAALQRQGWRVGTLTRLLADEHSRTPATRVVPTSTAVVTRGTR